jgi:hypothetical protein
VRTFHADAGEECQVDVRNVGKWFSMTVSNKEGFLRELEGLVGEQKIPVYVHNSTKMIKIISMLGYSALILLLVRGDRMFMRGIMNKFSKPVIKQHGYDTTVKVKFKDVAGLGDAKL